MLAADAVVTLSETMAAEVRLRGIPAHRVNVVPNAVDPDRFQPGPRDPALAASVGIEPGDVVVGYVTSITAYEGIPILLEAAARLRPSRRLKVLVVGEGPHLDDVRSAATALGLDDGTLVLPGATFSLNGTVGERTAANGFVKGFIIEDGIFKEDYGGGVSQSATTTFNAAFFAGLEDVEHKPHSFYIDRYPVGREATVAWPTVDLKFTNNTPYGVLIQAGTTPSSPSAQGVATVTMWSTKYWEITTSESARYNLTEPQTRVLRTEDCYPNTGYGGFDIDVTRHFHLPSDPTQDHDELMHTTYTPSDTVICKP